MALLSIGKQAFKAPKELESSLQRKCLNYLKKQFPTAYFRKISDKSISHIPDIIGCINGRFVGIELKRKGEIPRPGQFEELRLIESSKGNSA